MFADRRIWLMCLTYFSCAMGQYGLTFWMPALIQAAGVTHVFTIGLLTAIPYAAAVVAMILFGQSADRHRERRWHMATALLMGAAGLTVSAVAGTHTVIAMIALTVAAMRRAAGLAALLEPAYGVSRRHARGGRHRGRSTPSPISAASSVRTSSADCGI